MWKSVLYKEWLKSKWFFIIGTCFGFLVVGYVFLRVQHDFTFNDANNYWYAVLFQNFQYFGYLKYFPAVFGLALAISQYFPETVSKRIKLTFHLPVNENKVVLMMMLFGIVCLLLSFTAILGLFLILSKSFFPWGIIAPALISATPWFLSGFAIYFLVALIVLEPVWKYRFLYLVVLLATLPLFYESSIAGGYAPAIPGLFALVIISSIALLFSGYRFRKGEM
jgi:hypothetical protein